MAYNPESKRGWNIEVSNVPGMERFPSLSNSEREIKNIQKLVTLEVREFSHSAHHLLIEHN